jgi:3-mercaptopyruvate sulfurtransferase SseA
LHLSLESLQNGEQPSVASNRDIYVYSGTDDETTTAANLVRGFGFTQVAELKGGLNDWRSIGGAVEGITTEDGTIDADEFNVVSRLKEFAEERSREKALS